MSDFKKSKDFQLSATTVKQPITLTPWRYGTESKASTNYLPICNTSSEGYTTMSKINKYFKNLSLAFVVIALCMVAVPIGIGAIYAGDSCEQSILLPYIRGDE